MDQAVKKNELGARIAEAAFTLFKQYGVRSITLDEIALQLGISKKTIYEHFTGKNELVTEIIGHRIRLIQDKFMELTARSRDAIEANMLMMQYLDGLFRNMNPIVLMDLKKYHPEGFRIYQEHMNGFLIETMRHNMSRGIAEGLYREDINIEVMAYYRRESCNLCFEPGAFPKDHFEMSRVQRELLEHFLFGIATEKGYKLIMQYRKKILN
jgi:AcrR family transcriptional regulator